MLQSTSLLFSSSGHAFPPKAGLGTEHLLLTCLTPPPQVCEQSPFANQVLHLPSPDESSFIEGGMTWYSQAADELALSFEHLEVAGGLVP